MCNAEGLLVMGAGLDGVGDTEQFREVVEDLGVAEAVAQPSAQRLFRAVPFRRAVPARHRRRDSEARKEALQQYATSLPARAGTKSGNCTWPS